MAFETDLLSRRQFFERSGAALSLAGAVVLGFDFNPIRESRSRAVCPTAWDKVTADFLVLDDHFQSGGRTRIEARLANGTKARRKSAVEWIRNRRHHSMYDLICQRLQDGDTEVRYYAASVLGTIGSASLRPHLDLLAQAERGCKVDHFRCRLSNLIQEVEAS